MRIGIYGYGNLGKGIENAIKQNPDMELVAVFTRRDPSALTIATENAHVCNVKDVENYKDKIDVMILCGGSATDLPEQTPELATMFNVVDSFDTHAKIPQHLRDSIPIIERNGEIIAVCGFGFAEGHKDGGVAIELDA